MEKSCCDHDHHEHSHHGHNHDHGDGHHHPAQFTSQMASLTGLHCGDCATKLEKVISRIDGVSQIDVNFATSKMSVGYDESKTDFDTIVKSVRKLGYDVAQTANSNQNISTFRIEGMDCADCAQKLEKRVGAIPSVVRVSVNFGAAKMTVEHDGNAVEAVQKAVRQAGYSAMEEKEGAARLQTEQPFWKRNKKALTTAISGVLFLLAWIPSLMGMMEESTAAVLYAAAIVIGGYRIAKSGIYGLRSRTVGMDFLMTIAAVGAAVIGLWGEGAAVVFLFALGETLEAYTMDRTRNSIRSLMNLAPNTATVRRSGQTVTLPVEQIAVGDMMLVKPGEKIAMDGKRRGIVHAVPDHRHTILLLHQLFNGRHFILGKQLGPVINASQLGGNRLGRALVIPGKHDDLLHTGRLQFLDRSLAVRPDFVGDGNDRHHLLLRPKKHHRLAFLLEAVDL